MIPYRSPRLSFSSPDSLGVWGRSGSRGSRAQTRVLRLQRVDVRKTRSVQHARWILSVCLIRTNHPGWRRRANRGSCMSGRKPARGKTFLTVRSKGRTSQVLNFAPRCGLQQPSLPKLAMAKNEKTSKVVASQAAKILSNPKSTKAQKSVAASALTQAPDRKKGKKKR